MRSTKMAHYAILATGLVVAFAAPLAAFAADPVITPEDPNSAIAGALSGSVNEFGGAIAAAGITTFVMLFVAMKAYKWLRVQFSHGVRARA